MRLLGRVYLGCSVGGCSGGTSAYTAIPWVRASTIILGKVRCPNRSSRVLGVPAAGSIGSWGQMSPKVGRVWLNGERAGEHHLLEVSSGMVIKTVRLGGDDRATAGVGRRCGGQFASVYVNQDSGIVLQVDRDKFPLDGQTILSHESRFGGLMSILRIRRPGMKPRKLYRMNIAGALLKRVDPGYDELDESVDDFLADLADIAASDHRRAWLREVKDPLAGPWEMAS